MLKGDNALDANGLKKQVRAGVDFIRNHAEFAATLIIAIHIYIDWYLGLAFVAQVLTILLLFIFYQYRSATHPWIKPRALWLWILLLALAIIPAMHGLSLKDGAYYYFNVIFNALLMFWLGLAVV